MPHIGMPLAEHDAALIAGCTGLRRWLEPTRFSAELREWSAGATVQWPEGAFLRLGGRSFVTEASGARRIRSAEEALDVLSTPGDRAALMAQRCMLAGRPVWLFARAWRQIEPHEEFRVWIQGRRLVAASQHHHRHHFPGLVEHGAVLADAIAAFAHRLMACLHMPDVVADVWVRLGAKQACELIELNPAMSVTGRGLLGDSPIDELPRALHLLKGDGGTARFALLG